MLKILLAAGLALGAGAALARGPAHMNQELLGCVHSSVFTRIGTIAAQGDEAATEKLIAAAVATGECVALEKGQPVYIDDYTASDGVELIQVRPAGEVTDYWTLKKAVDP